MLEESQIVRLMDIANAGCHKGAVLEARTIYEAVLLLKPGHVPALIGQAMSHLVLNDFAKAEDMLRAVIAEHPDDADAKAMLGLCLSLAGRKEDAREVLEPLLDDTGSASALASSLLEHMGMSAS